MNVDEMIRGLVRAAESKEQGEPNGYLWDDEALAALTEARSRGWGKNRMGSLEAQAIDDAAVLQGAALRAAASVCDDIAQRAKVDRAQDATSSRRPEPRHGDVLAREQSTAIACRDAILALIEVKP